jgi:hypothetical protein
MDPLTQAQEALAAHVAELLHPDTVVPLVPSVPVAWTGYVWPATEWVSSAEGVGFCRDFEVRLVLDLVAPVTDMAAAQRWLNSRVVAVLAGSVDGVDVGGGQIVEPESASIVGLVRGSGTEVLVARVDFTPFELDPRRSS